jgi:hypothetical protein
VTQKEITTSLTEGRRVDSIEPATLDSPARPRRDPGLASRPHQEGRCIPTAEARIQTKHPSRYLVQLCRHASSINRKILRLHAGNAQARPEIQHVESTGTDGTLILKWGRCTMQAGPDTL